jgi:Na+-translocating ferredoxin:NAD+ oxidoreductase RnfC subunit
MMQNEIVAHMKEAGIVGAGGAGFPAYVKLSAKAEIALVNAAECEPLLHKDKELLQHRLDKVLLGLRTVMTNVGAKRGIIGIKEKHHALIATLREKIDGDIEVIPVRDFYPAGDEITLIFETTGRVVQAGTLPGSQGVVVNNVETLYNIGSGKPVISKFMNVTGEVARPVSMEVPIGISFQEVLDFAGPRLDHYIVVEGGPMMGRLVHDLSQPVTKTTAALIVLPVDHILIKRLSGLQRQKEVDRIGKAACDQCMICTELCPRYLLGHPIQPHKAMRSLLFTHEERRPELHTLYCCECNLCSFISCPEGLSPSMVCISNKREAKRQQLSYSGPIDNGVHPLQAYRRTPSKKLKTMLDLSRYADIGPLVDFTYSPSHVKVLLQQHIGKPAVPVIAIGEQVKTGQKLATVGQDLGAEIHAPTNGTVTDITEKWIGLACS